MKFYATLAALLMIAASPSALAHRSLNSNIKISMKDAMLKLEMGVTAFDLRAFDQDSDGRISKAEHDNQITVIQAWLGERIRIEDGDGHQITPDFEDAPVPHYSQLTGSDPIEGLRLIRRYSLPDSASPCVAMRGATEETRIAMVWSNDQIQRLEVSPDGSCHALMK